MNEFVAKFVKDFSLVSFLTTSTISRNVWYVDSGASRHMTSTKQLCSSLRSKTQEYRLSLVMMLSTQEYRLSLVMMPSTQEYRLSLVMMPSTQ
jgi:hypothetical protein